MKCIKTESSVSKVFSFLTKIGVYNKKSKELRSIFPHSLLFLLIKLLVSNSNYPTPDPA